MNASEEGSSAPGPPAPPGQQWHAPFNPWLIAGVATISSFMGILDGAIVIVALPSIAGNLGVSPDTSTWIVTAYLLCGAIVIPLSPWMSSLIGRRNYYLACVALFTTSSFLCGIAPNFELLLVFRLTQGLAGGGLVPTTQAILVDTFPARQRAMAMAMFALVVVMAPAIGPTLGGWITEQFTWRWIFLINIPVGCVSLILASRFITDPPYLPRRRGADRFKFDYVGFILIVMGLGGMQITLSVAARRGWFESSLVVALAVGSAVAIVSAILWELRHKDPLVNLRLLKDRNLGAAFCLLAVFGLPFYGGMILYPQFLQGLLNYTPTRSGMAYSAGGIVLVMMMPFVGWTVSRVDPRKFATLGLTILMAALYGMSHFSLETDFRSFALARMLAAFGVSMVFVPIQTMAYTYVSREARNSASSLMELGRSAGASMGIALIANTLERQSQVHQSHLVRHLTPYDPAYTGALETLTARFLQSTGDPVLAAQQARATLYNMLEAQSETLAFSDAYRILFTAILMIIPVLYVIRKPIRAAYAAAS